MCETDVGGSASKQLATATPLHAAVARVLISVLAQDTCEQHRCAWLCECVTVCTLLVPASECLHRWVYIAGVFLPDLIPARACGTSGRDRRFTDTKRASCFELRWQMTAKLDVDMQHQDKCGYNDDAVYPTNGAGRRGETTERGKWAMRIRRP